MSGKLPGDGPQWQNRIVGYGELPAADFLANDENWRIHPQAQQEALDGVLTGVGWVDGVIVNRRTSEEWGPSRGVETLVDGHLRVTMALRKGDRTPVPVKYVDLTPNEERLVLASLDPIAALAATDRARLNDLMQQVQSDDARVQEMLAGLAEREGIVNLEEVEFKEYDESVGGDVEYIECPECGHKFPK